MRPIPLVAALLVAATLVSCDEAVDPILETDRQFTLFGTLDMASDTQFVRVIEIRPTLLAPDQKLEASFTSQQLGTDIRHVWRDSVHTFDDGTVGHIFYAPFRVLAGKTYAMEARKPGSELVTTVSTQVPFALRPAVQLEEVRWILTTQLVATQRVLWWSLDEDPYGIEQWYRFFVFDDYGFEDIRLNHGPASSASQTHEGFWDTRIDLVRDRDSLKTHHAAVFTRGYLVGLGITMTVLDGEYKPPGGVFTAAALSQPGTLSNVTNGFGYVGSIGRFTAEWLLQDTTSIALGYKILERGAHLDILDRVWDEPLGTYERPQQ